MKFNKGILLVLVGAGCFGFTRIQSSRDILRPWGQVPRLRAAVPVPMAFFIPSFL